MAFLHPEDVPADLRARAAGIRLAAFDVDGTLTDGRLHYGPHDQESKTFHVHDGLGLKLLLDAGIEVALLSARRSEPLIARAAELGIAHVHQEVADKRASLKAICQAAGIAAAEAAFMGDDLPDLPAMRWCGLSATPADAHPWVAAQARWRSSFAGGEGAVRELCDLLLAARGRAAAVLAEILEQ